MIISTESIHKKQLKMPSWEARVQRPSGLIKRGESASALSGTGAIFYESKYLKLI
jgi:hypothetical protein